MFVVSNASFNLVNRVGFTKRQTMHIANGIWKRALMKVKNVDIWIRGFQT